MGPVAVGVDIVEVVEVEDSIRNHAERYLERVYTAREIADSRLADGSTDARRLAATFAAKEAALKALRATGAAIAPTDIEVTQRGSRLALRGAAASLAAARGIAGLQLSSSVTDDYAAAIVVAQIETAQ